MRIVILIALVALFATLSPSAQAQIAPSRTTVDASASFEDAPDPPLDLKVTSPVAFGRVTIPNALNAKSVCRYNVTSVRGVSTGASVDETIDGVVVPGSNAGCAFKGNPNVGTVQLRCREGLQINYTIAYTNGGVRGATFGLSDVTGTRTGEFGSGPTANQRRFGDLFRTGTFRCTTIEGEGVGTGFMYLNGALYVTDIASLPRGSNVTVGTVQVDVSY